MHRADEHMVGNGRVTAARARHIPVIGVGGPVGSGKIDGRGAKGGWEKRGMGEWGIRPEDRRGETATRQDGEGRKAKGESEDTPKA